MSDPLKALKEAGEVLAVASGEKVRADHMRTVVLSAIKNQIAQASGAKMSEQALEREARDSKEYREAVAADAAATETYTRAQCAYHLAKLLGEMHAKHSLDERF
jgi:hypothetical protein